MGAYIVRRVLLIIPTLLLVYTIAFFMVHATPGGPWDNAEKPLPPAVIENIKIKYHLDDPIWKQYLEYLSGAVRGDLGPSYVNRSQDVADILRRAFPVSLQLGITALVLGALIGIPLGTLAAVKQNTLTDYLAMFFAVVGVSTPNYVTASALVLILAVFLHWLPPGGWHGVFSKTIIIPALALAFGPASALARYIRSSMLEVLRQDYMRTARAKGLSDRVVIIGHGLRNALVPVITVSAFLVADVITGSFFVETITSVPGLGRYFVNAATGRDYPVVLALSLLFAIVIVVMNLVVDVLYAVLDPRVRYR
ncbi:MAG TPA: ABC transporter permease [Thermomicrobiaceae bacterium]|nr:ABC transporter permease [Thermomicrobiaceae bacterium]